MRADIVTGAVFPDYELTDHTGKRLKLSELQGPDPMILVLSRGGYCPKDRLQAEGQVQLHHEMEVGYSRLVTSSVPTTATSDVGVSCRSLGVPADVGAGECNLAIRFETPESLSQRYVQQSPYLTERVPAAIERTKVH